MYMLPMAESTNGNKKNGTLQIKMLAQKNQNTLDVNTCLKC